MRNALIRIAGEGGAVVQSVLDVVFPRYCAGCNNTVDRPTGHLCWNCFSTLDHGAWVGCERCGLRLASPVHHAFVCSACEVHPPSYDRARSAGRFSGVLREMVHQFKYDRATWLCSDLAGMLHGCVLAHYPVSELDCLLAVPLHPGKRRDRGYNQSELLASELARRLQRPCFPNILTRTRNTATQTRLTAAQRRQNVHAAFEAREQGWIRNRTILLVDDVMTTGATLSAAASALKRAGAWRVWGVTVARG